MAWKLGIYGLLEEESLGGIEMDYYFVVDKDSDEIASVIQRSKNVAPVPVAGKRFVKTDGVRMTFYIRLKEAHEVVTLEDVMNY